MSAAISTEKSADSRSICRPSLDRYIYRYIGRASVDMSTDISVEGCTKYTWSIFTYFILFIIITFTYIILFYLRTRLLARGMRVGSKMECVVLCDFYFCCAFIFGQPMKKFEFFGVSRATCQRHFKPEDEWLWGREWEMTGCDSCHHMRCHSVLCSPVFSVPPNTGH